MQASGAVEPVYGTTSPNVPIELGTHRVTLFDGDRSGLQGDATFVLRLLPYPRISASLQLPQCLPVNGLNAIEIPALSTRFSILSPSVTHSSAGTKIDLRPNPDHVDVFMAEHPKLNQVAFHVLNCCDFRPGRSMLEISTPARSHYVARILLEADGWRVTLHALPETRSLVRALDSEGGYAITHVGKIERIAGESFTPEAVEEVLDVLRLFLSFARGSFVSISLVVGYNGSVAQWERWGSSIVYFWRHYEGCLSGAPGRLLEDLFPGFFKLLKHPDWSRPVRTALYWYLRANNTSEGPGVDGGIMLAQASLEKLAWAKCKRRGRIDVLLKENGIPVDIPCKLQALTSLAQEHRWADGPAALVNIRTDLVHAEERFSTGNGDPFFEVWSLAQQYIELCILRLADYSGSYTDRISGEWMAETVRVPWAR